MSPALVNPLGSTYKTIYENMSSASNHEKLFHRILQIIGIIKYEELNYSI